jgi:hypothetical protein
MNQLTLAGVASPTYEMTVDLTGAADDSSHR